MDRFFHTQVVMNCWSRIQDEKFRFGKKCPGPYQQHWFMRTLLWGPGFIPGPEPASQEVSDPIFLNILIFSSEKFNEFFKAAIFSNLLINFLLCLYAGNMPMINVMGPKLLFRIGLILKKHFLNPTFPFSLSPEEKNSFLTRWIY